MRDEFGRKIVLVCLDPEDKHPLFVFDDIEAMHEYCKESVFEIRNNPAPGGHHWYEYGIWRNNRAVGWVYKTVMRF